MEKSSDVRALFRQQGYTADYEAFISWPGRNGATVAVTGLSVTSFEWGTRGPDPLRFASDVGEPRLGELIQAIVDGAWEAGIRPTYLKDDQERPALQRHLADMRALAFFKIGIPKP